MIFLGALFCILRGLRLNKNKEQEEDLKNKRNNGVVGLSIIKLDEVAIVQYEMDNTEKDDKLRSES